MSMRRLHVGLVVTLLFIGALAVNLGLGVVLGLDRPMESDAYYYYQLAVSLAQDGGYVIRDGFWPREPTLSRMPGWPAAVSVALRAVPQAPPVAVMRMLNLVINAACAVAVCGLTWLLIGRLWAMLVAGGIYLAHPMALSAAVDGMAEPSFVLLVVLGTMLVYIGLGTAAEAHPVPPRRLAATWAGFLLLGLACLVRANFVAWIGFFGVAIGIWALRKGAWRLPSWWLALGVGALIFLTPPLLWAVRNQRLCGEFPVLSTLRGQTFYGGNNSVTAYDFQYWGYWVFPNQIPGETPMLALSHTMSEYDVDVYYMDKGEQFIREHRGRMPWLLLGKLVRAYVPIPWKPIPSSIIMGGLRFLLYGFFLVGLARYWRTLPPTYRAVFAGMILTNVLTVLSFYGYSRFAFEIEPFLMPLAAAAVVQVVTRQI